MSKTKSNPPADPFGGEFSQERASAATTLPSMQWHGGLASLVGDSDSMKVNGGFFIADDRLVELGLAPDEPLPSFERVTLTLGGNPVPGWGATLLHLAFIFTDFGWEEREAGQRYSAYFPATEYERRKQQAPGTERTLRGRLRALVGVRELLNEGVLEPVVLSVRGTYSAALNAILRDVGRMAEEATKLRRLAGHGGEIPREAFWVPIGAGQMEEVGAGSRASRVARPVAYLPTDLTREAMAGHLVDREDRAPDGLFDQWARDHKGWNAPTMPQAQQAAITALDLGEAARQRAEEFYARATSLGYWNRTEINDALQALGYTGVPVRGPRVSEALEKLEQRLAQMEQAGRKREVARG